MKARVANEKEKMRDLQEKAGQGLSYHGRFCRMCVGLQAMCRKAEGAMVELKDKIMAEISRVKVIDNCFEILSKKFGVSEEDVKKAIRELCLEGKIIPNPYTNTKIPN